MTWLHLQRDILEDMAELHHLVERRETENPNAEGLEGRRRAYRARQRARGECIYCRSPAATEPGRKVQLCERHLEIYRRRARERWRAARAA